MRAAVLILTGEHDAHADLMVQVLQRKGISVFRFDPVDIPSRACLSANWSKNASWSSISSDRRTVDLDRMTSVWLRRPTPWAPRPTSQDSTIEFIRAERDQAIAGLWMNMKAFWVNDFISERTAATKPHQLTVASEMGFIVPRTLLTNDASEVLHFYKECHGDVVYKTLSSTDPQYLNRSVYTSPVGEQHLEFVERVSTAPCLFQKNIPKQFEIRITVVGHRVFGAVIYSQQMEETRYDWRRDHSGKTENRSIRSFP